MNNKSFVHWHCHSEYSSLDGLSKVDDLVMTARGMGFPALALTDHGNIMGWIKFIQKCCQTKDKNGEDISVPTIKPILGQEFYLSRKMDIGQYDSDRDTEKIKRNQPDGRKGNRHINLYAMNYAGYQNICKLSQAAFTDGFYFDPRIDFDLLSKHSEGVLLGSACLSSVINANLMHERYNEAKAACQKMKDIFGENFFLEIMYHGIAEEKQIIPYILKLSNEMNVPVLATNDCHYVRKSDAESQEVLLCMSQRKCLKDPKRMKFSSKEFYLKSADEMEHLFGDIPHVLTNTVIMAERINSKDIEDNIFGGMRLPKFEVPQDYKSPYDYLSFLAWEGMRKLGWKNSEPHVEALKKELGDIQVAQDSNDYDFATYFLIVKDYIDYCRNKNILTGAGRGSGYSSVLLRCLGITYGVDPVAYGLLWERFLGFSDKRFIKDSDFGFADKRLVIKLNDIDGEDDIDDDRVLEDDLGGVDRY